MVKSQQRFNQQQYNSKPVLQSLLWEYSQVRPGRLYRWASNDAPVSQSDQLTETGHWLSCHCFQCHSLSTVATSHLLSPIFPSTQHIRGVYKQVQVQCIGLLAILTSTAEDSCVCAGHAYNVHDRCVASGYDNGDIKLFDLRSMALRWETNVKNGVSNDTLHSTMLICRRL